MKTIVKFLKNTDKEGNTDLFAYFPHVDFNQHLYGSAQKQSYSHEGQHSACSPDYAQESELASYEEYKPLLDELIAQGYNDLEIVNQQIETIHYNKSYEAMYSKLLKDHKTAEEFNTISEEWIAKNAPKYLLKTN
jgi:hypothetical protein